MAVADQETEVRTKFWTLKRAAAKVPMLDQVVAGYYCALDRETPLRVKGILLAALGYFVLPTDAIPDVLLGIGFTDDIAVLTAALSTGRAHVKPSHVAAAREALRDWSGAAR